jgi:hypothetical protein
MHAGLQPLISIDVSSTSSKSMLELSKTIRTWYGQSRIYEIRKMMKKIMKDNLYLLMDRADRI